jgi:hypothetical protein
MQKHKYYWMRVRYVRERGGVAAGGCHVSTAQSHDAEGGPLLAALFDPRCERALLLQSRDRI